VNKKLNTVFFILGATVFNVIVAIISFILLAIIYGRFIRDLIPEAGRHWGPNLLIIASIAISIFVYRFVLKALLARMDIEKYFDPLFVSRNMKKNLPPK